MSILLVRCTLTMATTVCRLLRSVMLLLLHLRKKLLVALKLLSRRHTTLARTWDVSVGHLVLLLVRVLHPTTLLRILLRESLHILLRHLPTWLHLSLWYALSVHLWHRKMAVPCRHGKRRASMLRHLTVHVGVLLIVDLHLRMLLRHIRCPWSLLAIVHALSTLLCSTRHCDLSLLCFNHLLPMLPLSFGDL